MVTRSSKLKMSSMKYRYRYDLIYATDVFMLNSRPKFCKLNRIKYIGTEGQSFFPPYTYVPVIGLSILLALFQYFLKESNGYRYNNDNYHCHLQARNL